MRIAGSDEHTAHPTWNRGLMVVDEVSKSISSFVKVAVGEDSEGGKAQEAFTRTCHRNKNPLYAQVRGPCAA